MSHHTFYFYPEVVALRKGTLPPKERIKAIRKIGALVGNPEALNIILGIDPAEFASFFPDIARPTPSTLETIDSFIGKYAEDKLPEGSDAKDYKLLIKQADDFIKNRNYEAALEIISALHLNNPEKSIYFADQIRFLKRLIENETNKKNAKSGKKTD